MGDFVLTIETNNDLSADAVLGDAQRSANDAVFFLEHGETLDVELAGNSDNTNELGFVRLDIDATSGARSVDGVAYGDTDAFRDAVVNNLDDAFSFTRGGSFRESSTWTVAGEDGFYVPVLQAGKGDVLIAGDANPGDANPGGDAYVSMFGHNTFGFEELLKSRGSDFDFNDMVMTLSLPSGSLTDDWLI